MRTNHPYSIALLVLTIASNLSFAATKNDTIPESKVDYLERIYFSGENKDGLNNLILETLQDLEGKHTSMAVAVQYQFLSGIKSVAEQAQTSCDVEELLAAGIYGIDVREALKQEIPRPSEKQQIDAQTALNDVSNISGNTKDAAVSGWYLSNGNATVAKAGAAAEKLGTATSTASSIVNAYSQAKALANALHLSKDKPCKDVPKKEIVIGDHPLPAENALAPASK